MHGYESTTLIHINCMGAWFPGACQKNTHTKKTEATTTRTIKKQDNRLTDFEHSSFVTDYNFRFVVRLNIIKVVNLTLLQIYTNAENNNNKEETTIVSI